MCLNMFSAERERGSDDSRTIFRSSVFGRMEELGGSSRTPSWWKDCGAAERTPPKKKPSPPPPPPTSQHTLLILLIHFLIIRIFGCLICPELRFAHTRAAFDWLMKCSSMSATPPSPHTPHYTPPHPHSSTHPPTPSPERLVVKPW